MPDQSYQKRCTKCSEVKTSINFVRCSESKDGLHWWCKACFRTVRVVRERDRASRPLVELDPLKQRRCADCGEMKTEIAFSRQRVNKEGLQYICRDCVRRRATLRALAKALGPIPKELFQTPAVKRALLRLAEIGPLPADAQAAGITPAYAAGFFDGEGYIGIGRTKKVRDTEGPFYTLNITVTNTNLEVLERFRSTFGGRVTHKSDNSERWKQCHYWRASSWGAVGFLQAVLPFLVVKRRQAEIALDFQRTMRHTGNRWQVAPPAERERRESLYQQILVLNKRGPVRTRPL
jgi:hypothetical protein